MILNELYVIKDFLIDTMERAIQKHLTDNPEKTLDKDEFDLVTSVDYEIETFISEAINNKYSNDVIIGEEFSPNKVYELGRCWTIDPIDGTVNYARGRREFGVQCSFVRDGMPVVAVIIVPYSNKKYWAIKGEGAYLNNIPIHVSENTMVDKSIVHFGDFSHKNDGIRKIQNKSIEYLSSNVSKIRMVGAACIDYSSVAEGKADGLISITKNVWDIFPGIILCQEAGAILTNIDGSKYKPGDEGVIAASNNTMFDVLLKSIKY